MVGSSDVPWLVNGIATSVIYSHCASVEFNEFKPIGLYQVLNLFILPISTALRPLDGYVTTVAPNTGGCFGKNEPKLILGSAVFVYGRFQLG